MNIKWLITKLFKKAHVKVWWTTSSVSFNDKIILKEIPIALPVDPISFYKLNNDLSHFEVTLVNKKTKEITLVELASNTEIKIDFKTFDLLFSKVNVPEEVKF